MTNEELKELATKVKNGTSSAEEDLLLLKFLNQGVGELKTFIKDITKENK